MENFEEALTLLCKMCEGNKTRLSEAMYRLSIVATPVADRYAKLSDTYGIPGIPDEESLFDLLEARVKRSISGPVIIRECLSDNKIAITAMFGFSNQKTYLSDFLPTRLEALIQAVEKTQ